ncbi:PTS sugar transporter subunit IIB [Companilactobacillus halodurans]|uniref:PTS sugar transporter subunit IIB n=1 Tax=Companilactobacillus halodurans TaxID=2584183 RepID=A0A5P0ZZA0_9LACO|nr:PTS sugar transporter subunit IIB [Companilactobacillus halodurans]MQS76581.1 PTS sugar transporter subunit IIB [Companilactobacillus halodurans]MQS98215.1 PTS sugar transporter subunit IIB [Companilactobacillus halodurans]
MTTRVLLVCGSGASSGFMAANMRKAAKKRDLDLKIQARSESELENYLNEIDVLMIGPHLAYLEDEMKDLVSDKVKVILMNADYYSILDGSKAVDHLLNVIGDK